MIKTIIFDAFGTLFKVRNGASANTIINNLSDHGIFVEEKTFFEEWKSFYKAQTSPESNFKTERDIFISRIQMFYDKYKAPRNARIDAESILAEAFNRRAYPEIKNVLSELMKKYTIFIASNTDNDVLESVMKNNNISVHKVYTSESLKCYKPDPKFFKQILFENNISPNEVLFVGDSISDDILGPKHIGISTVWVDRNGRGGNYGQDYTITNINELINIVMQN